MAISLVAPGNGDTPSIALSSNGSTITLGQQNCAVDDLFIVFGGNKSSNTSTSIAVVDPGVGTPSTPTEWDLPSFPYNYGTASGASQNRVAVAWWFRITAADIDTAAGDLVEVEISPPAQNCQYCINVWRGVGTTDFDGAPASNTMVGLQIQVDNASLGRTFLWTDSDTIISSTPWSDTFFDSSMTVLAMAINDRSNWNAPNQLAFPSGWTTCIYGVGSTLASNEISSNGQSSVMLYSQYANFADADATSDPGMATPLDLADTSGNTTTTRQLTLWMAFKEDGANAYTFTKTDSSTASDTLTLTKATTETRTDTATTSDTLSASKSATETNTDSSTASDTLTTQRAATESNTDSSTASDTLTATKAISLSVTDSATSSDILSATKSKDITKTDSSTAADALTAVKAGSISITDSATASDVYTESGTSELTETDSVTAADTLVVTKTAIETNTDTATASDGLVATKTAAFTETDSSTASDTLTAAKGVTLSITDSATASDVYDASKTVVLKESSTSTTSDTLTIQKDSTLSVTDVTTSSDILVTARSATTTITDSSTTSDTLSVNKASAVTLTDSSTASDELDANTAGSSTFTETDSSTTSDTLLATKSVALTLTDSVTASDTYIDSEATTITETDSATAADTLSAIKSVALTFTDSATTSDTVAASRALIFTVEDSSSTTDTLLKTRAANLAFTDSSTTSDQLDRMLEALISLTDSSSTGDTLTATGPVVTEISVTIPGIGSVSAELLTEEEALAVIDIWNTALTTLGITAVTSTTDSSPQQLLLTNVYPLFKRQFLADHLWNGAKKTKALTALKDNAGDAVTPPSRWTYAFDLPDDVLRVWRLNGLENQPDYIGGFSSNMWEIEVIVTDEGEVEEALTRSLCTDESTATIEYVFDVGDDNIGLLGPLTQHALGRALAVYVAQNFGKNTTEIAQLEALAKEALLAAKGVDGQEGSPQIFSPTSLLGVRYI